MAENDEHVKQNNKIKQNANLARKAYGLDHVPDSHRRREWR